MVVSATYLPWRMSVYPPQENFLLNMRESELLLNLPLYHCPLFQSFKEMLIKPQKLFLRVTSNTSGVHLDLSEEFLFHGSGHHRAITIAIAENSFYFHSNVMTLLFLRSMYQQYQPGICCVHSNLYLKHGLAFCCISVSSISFCPWHPLLHHINTVLEAFLPKL